MKNWKNQQRDKKGRFMPVEGLVNQTGYTLRDLEKAKIKAFNEGLEADINEIRKEAFIAGYNAHGGFMTLSQKLNKFLRGVK